MLPWRLRDRTLDLAARPLVMGIVNVTPDSFSDGGEHADPESAVAHALQLIDEGADLLDIGGESTRPGSQPVPVDLELARVVPVVEALCKRTSIPISVDTSKAAVARACCELGAHIINDVTGLRGDPDMIDVARHYGAGVIVMHMQGTPATMQLAPSYTDVVAEVAAFFDERIATLGEQGIAPECIALDPGIGFGKTHEHTLALLHHLPDLRRQGRPLCLGVSRKGFIGIILNRPRDQRAVGSVAVAAFAMAQQGAQVLRVHDVAATRDLVLMWEALQRKT